MPELPPGKHLVHVVLKQQVLSGTVDGDSAQEIFLEVTDGSILRTAVSGQCAAPVRLRLTADSQLILTGDTVLAALDNEDASGRNIVTNGYKLDIAKPKS
jgi:hypothetical protein